MSKFYRAVLFFIVFLQIEANSQNDNKIAALVTKIGKWECEALYKDSSTYNMIKSIGNMSMEFLSSKTRKDIKQKSKNGTVSSKKVMEVTNTLQLLRGDKKLLLNYSIKNDSIQFDGMNEQINDFKVLSANKNELVLLQQLEGGLFKWILQARKK